MSKRIFTDEWRAKLSEAAKRRANTAEGKAQLGQANKGNTHSEDTKAKISQAGMGRVQSEETKAKRVESRAGYTHSDETREKISLAKHGKPQSIEANAKRSETLKGRPQSPEHIAARTAARKANDTWFQVEDIGERISKGQIEAFAELPEEAKEVERENARKVGKAQQTLPDKNCEICGALMDTYQSRRPGRRTCSDECKAQLKYPPRERKPRLGEERQCPVDGIIFWVKRCNLKPINYCSVSCAQKVRTGEKNSNWRDGATPENMKARRSSAYRTWRMAVLVRDQFICQDCSSDTNLHAHHIEGFSEHTQKRFEVANGLTLCMDCHEKVHGFPVGPGSKFNGRIRLTCPTDGVIFERKRSDVKEGRTNYCSGSCRARAKRKPRIRQPPEAIKDAQQLQLLA